MKDKQMSKSNKQYVTPGPSGIAHTFRAPKKSNPGTPDRFIPKGKPKAK